jgi:hypothetical protein
MRLILRLTDSHCTVRKLGGSGGGGGVDLLDGDRRGSHGDPVQALEDVGT